MSVIVAVVAGTAIASGGNKLKVKPPKHAQSGKQYSIKVTGNAVSAERLYVFIDYLKCGSSPYTEHYINLAPGVYSTVSGTFKKVSKWTSGLKKTDHACVYLVQLSQPLNSSSGVLAHKSKAYKIN